jgi:phytoene/squalene synthetase
MKLESSASLAASITKKSSRQTYYTIRFLADHDLIGDAYRTYAYFRWVDDHLDTVSLPQSERNAFLQRQASLLEGCYRGEEARDVCQEEQMLVDLVRNDPDQQSGLHFYLYNMMAVMAFDANRRGRLISQLELCQYTDWLAGAVTEAMHYFIGHNCPSPHDETRYLAVTAAHITHMLRDTLEDNRIGYYNIPEEVLRLNHISPQDVESDAYRTWVKSRVQLARDQFQAGRNYLKRVANPRCRLTGYAYTARFDWLLDTIEREEFYLRPEYGEQKSFTHGWRMGWDILATIFGVNKGYIPTRHVTVRAKRDSHEI